MRSSDLMAVLGIVACLYVGLNYCRDSAIFGMEEELRERVRGSARSARVSGLTPNYNSPLPSSLNHDDMLVFVEDSGRQIASYAAIKPVRHCN